MKNSKLFSVLAILAYSMNLNGQVGINTSSPTSTLDVMAKNTTGTATTVDGLLIPRVDRQRAQSMNAIPISTLIYINSIATGSQTGIAANVDAVGHYFYDGIAWSKLNSASTNSNVNVYNVDGAITENRVVHMGAKKFTFKGTSTNAFSVAGTTLSVDAANDRLGIGTITPSNKLHITGNNPLRLEGITTGDKQTDKLMVLSATGVVKTISTLASLSIPDPAIFKLATDQNNFLNGYGAGGSQVVPMSFVKSTIPGLTYNAGSSTITFPAGTYQITFVYEASHNNTGCTLSSYFVDFPLTSGFQRVHNTAAHVQGGLSVHGNAITYTTTLPANTNWEINLGRGQSGNCGGTGMILNAGSTQLLVFRMGD